MTWLDKQQGKTVVVKFGGNAMVDDQLVSSFAEDVAWLSKSGVKVVVVHGGGPQITKALEQAEIPSSFVDGLRYTSKEAAQVIRDVLMEQVSKPLASLIESYGVKTSVLNGVTEDLFLAEITRPDLGYVGEVYAVRDSFLDEVLDRGIIPVISTIAPNDDGDLVNVNADLAASSVAVALSAHELVILTDVDGLYLNWPDTASLVAELSQSELERLLPRLEAGMIPKVQGALSALYGGVSSARIINGSKVSALRNLALGDKPVGTLVKG